MKKQFSPYLLHALALHPLRSDAAARDRRPAAEGFEARVHNVAVIVYPDLELHNIAARRGANKACPNVDISFVKGAHVARVLVVVDHVLVVAPARERHRRGGQQAGDRGGCRAARQRRRTKSAHAKHNAVFRRR
eukprot:CAMPEP_0177754586 /NCGR_PEP_ID=MMETSP0491_2-20121128/2088_1 /TAXON_ID=63592 /ORGANISM="Tetraselmis chuii, Strain PLY429" /LENGTH=133 /DNA_ID=CAMNT_0019269979 /DNA_START=378 /DNA_END=779 /DNA_ORIENTATION=+